MALLGQGWDDPQSSAIMALAGNMVQGNFGGGLLGASNAYQGAQEGLLKQQLMTEELALKRLAEQRAQAMFKMQQDAYNGVGQDAPQLPSQPAIPGGQSGPLGSGTYGVSMPGQQASAPPQNNVAAQLNRLERQAYAGIPGAKEALDIFKYKNDPQKVDPGSYSRNAVTGAMTFNPDPKVGLTLDGQGNITRMGGSQNIAGMAGDAALATEGAKDQFAPPTMVNTPGGPRLMTPAQARAYANGGAQPRPFGQGGSQSNPVPNNPFANLPAAEAGVSGAFKGDPAQVIASIADIKDPQERANAYAAFAQQMKTSGGNLQSDNLPGGALKTPDQETSDLTKRKFGESMAAKTAEILDKGHTAATSAADDLLGIAQSRKALQGGVFVGSGAETKLAVAKFVNANIPGVTIDPNKVGDTDYLKSTLGDGLLKMAKTLGSNPSNADANRINDIVGSIGKDPNALAKILDWRQEMAQRAISQHNARVDQAEASGYKPPFDLRVKSPVDDQKPPGGGNKPPIPMKGMVRNGYKYKGGNPADPSSWEKQ